jgi:small-conductance mechanosensitive channel
MAAKSKWYQILLEAFMLLVLMVINFLPASILPIPERHDYAIHTLFSFFIFWLSVRLIVRVLKWWYRKHNKIPAEKDDNVIYGISNLYFLLIVTFGILTALALFGINYRELFTSLSIVAAAIAIISKDFITEIISGFLISFSRQINNDDYVKIGEHKGRIIDIKLAKTTLLNEDDDLIIIPNNKVFSSEIINYTQREVKKISTEFEIGLDAFDSLEQIETELAQTLEEYQKFIRKDSLNLKIVGIKKDLLQMKFQYVLHQVDREVERTLRRDVARKVVALTKQAKQAVRQDSQALTDQSSNDAT